MFMYFVPLYVNGRQGTYRAQMLAGSAADAGLFVDSRDRGRQIIIRIGRQHLDGPYRTVAGAVATLSFAQSRYAVMGRHNGMANLNA